MNYLPRLPKSRKGLTLVELLIVVAIVGVLSTVGIPTYRKLVAKARKSEAKVGLSGVYTVEAAFFSEYNSYGNNLKQMGFEYPGGSAAIYAIGFPTTACAVNTTIQPTAASAVTGINGSFNAYFNTSTSQMTFGRTGGVCVLGNSLADGTAYNASATGAILGGSNTSSDTTNGCAKQCQDAWVIDENRNLQNIVLGESS